MTGSIVPEASWKTASRNNKLGLFADRTSCYRWWPNQFRLLMGRPTEGRGAFSGTGPRCSLAIPPAIRTLPVYLATLRLRTGIYPIRGTYL